ncbi:uncharacterized protein BKA78DRAFT_28042 [Phyllosticta capitalensis]|uniref:uncharacterized protein n=1 Tax=Phyllosticta capitalensis TaxID=121624 RepID=UPI003131BEB0
MGHRIRHDDPMSRLMNNLTKFYKSGEHSDVTLKTKDGNRHKVHKLILRCQSAFFDRALDPVSGWKEAVSGEMQLDNDDPENVQAMLDWMYTLNYECPSHLTSRPERTMFHIQMYAMGDIYDAPSLKELAARHFDADVDYRSELFPDAVRAVYATTPPSDRGLRDRILKVCATNISELLGSSGSNSSNNANTSASISADTGGKRPFRGKYKYNGKRAQSAKGAHDYTHPTSAPIPSKAEFANMMDDLGVFGRELTTFIAFNPSARPAPSHAASGGGTIMVHRYRCGVCRATCGMELPAPSTANDNEQLISCMFCQAAFSPTNWRSRRVGPGEMDDVPGTGEPSAGPSSVLDDNAAVRAPPLERADVLIGADVGSPHGTSNLGEWEVRPTW